MSEFLKEEPIEQFPAILRELQQIQNICTSEKKQYEKLEETIRRLEDDQFFLTASKNAATRYENEFGINKTASETLEFRRERLINRTNSVPPYTVYFVASKLDEIIGAGNWQAYLNKERTIFTIEASMESKSWYNEFRITFEQMKPCTVMLITKPYINSSIVFSESKESTKIRYHKLSEHLKLTGWKLCSKENYEGVDAVTDLSGVIIDNLNNTYEAIDSILINDSIMIKVFTKTKDTYNNQVIINYAFDGTINTADLKEITSVKILKKNGDTLTESKVYVPYDENMRFKQIIKIKEGE